MKVIAVVVTYNRLELLKRTIGSLRRNEPLNGVVVVNNGSTDGTGTWLADEVDGWLQVVTQENVGGSGGFHTGISYACREGADWIWCMDDDVFPRPDCLSNLLAQTGWPGVGVMAPRRLLEGRVFSNDFTAYNLTNPFASMYIGKGAGLHAEDPAEIVGTAFEGLFVKRETVERIGLPNKELFIFCDDTDYCLRAVQAGYKILYVPQALMDKHRFFAANDGWAARNRQKKWKRYYQVRNSTYLNHHYGRNWAVRYLRGFIGMAGYWVTALLTIPFTDAWQWGDLSRLWRAYSDGLHERLGKMD